MNKSVMSQIRDAIDKNRNESGLKYPTNIEQSYHLQGKADGLELALKILVSNLSQEEILKLWEAKA